MWDWINCHLLGRHDQSVSWDQGTIHLRCRRCGHRTPGWQLDHRELAMQASARRVVRPLLRLAARRQA